MDLNKIITVLPIAAVSVYLINRFVFSPRFTNRALHQFILDTFRTKQFSDLSEDHEEIYEFGGRSVIAHWNLHREETLVPFVVEFDVHPSTFRFFTISASIRIRIENEGHFNHMRNVINSAGDYSEFLQKW
jgi:hypothetical protein